MVEGEEMKGRVVGCKLSEGGLRHGRGEEWFK